MIVRCVMSLDPVNQCLLPWNIYKLSKICILILLNHYMLMPLFFVVFKSIIDGWYTKDYYRWLKYIHYLQKLLKTSMCIYIKWEAPELPYKDSQINSDVEVWCSYVYSTVPSWLTCAEVVGPESDIDWLQYCLISKVVIWTDLCASELLNTMDIQ